jgi:hypothetical protein
METQTPEKEKRFALGELKRFTKNIEIIQSGEVIGSGLTEEDPQRTLISFWTKDGQLMFTVDPYMAAKQQEAQAKSV